MTARGIQPQEIVDCRAREGVGFIPPLSCGTGKPKLPSECSMVRASPTPDSGKISTRWR
jgi:hypothetical protein